MGYYLGLNIGVASVGYGILNEDGDIVTAGVRLFPQQDKTNNADRRMHRHLRRGIRRKKHRLERGDRLFVRSGLVEWSGTAENKYIDIKCDKDITPYHLRVKGLNEELTNKDLVIALRHLLKRRGLQDFDIKLSDSKEADAETESTKAILNQTQERLAAGEYICELQLESLLSEHYANVRGINNRFFTRDYEAEAIKILDTQSKFNPLITDTFKTEYLGLLNSRRAYYEGPGAGSPYGWEGDIEKWMDSLVGNCTYFPEEQRLPKAAPTAEFFNLLNDLNNLKVNGKHLTQEEKIMLIEDVFKKQKTVSLKTIAKALGINAKITKNDNTFEGYRINTKEEAIFTSLSGWHFINTANENSGNTVNMNDFDLLDKIAKYLTAYQSSEVKDVLIEKLALAPDFAEELANVYNISGNPFKGSHSLSKKAMLCVLEDMWTTTSNSSTLFIEKNLRPQYSNMLVKNGHINSAVISKLSVSSVVRRSVNQTFKVFNELIDRYHDFDTVTIELTREKSEEDRIKTEKKIMKNNETINKLVTEIIGTDRHSGLFTKVKLYILQDGKDMYTGKPIDLDSLLRNPAAYHVNHIIPLSVSFDDSLANKVLTTATVGQAKGQRTPYQFLTPEEFGNMSALIFELKNSKTENGIPAVQKMPKKKIQNLLFKEDITKWDVQKAFTSRNLVDTRYASNEVAVAMRECFKASGRNTVVRTVNGSWTNYLRKKWNIEKDRKLDYSYSAIDALVIASTPFVTVGMKTISKYEKHPENDSVIDRSTGEIMSLEELDKYSRLILNVFDRCGRNIGNFKDIKYSHKVDKKHNRALSNDTLYSTRFEENIIPATKKKPEHTEITEWKVNKIGDLYDPKLDLKKLHKMFSENPEKLLVFKNDYRSFEKLLEVYSNPDYQIDEKGKEANPFYMYFKLTGNYITKYAKHNDGPPIKSLKYLDTKINSSPIDISKKQGCKNNKRVIMDGVGTYRIDVFYNGDTYKNLNVRYIMLKSINKPVVIPEIYEKEKIKCGITDDYVFHFSLFKNDLLEFNGEQRRITGVQSSDVLTGNYIDRNANLQEKDSEFSKKPVFRISPSVRSINKINSSPLGIFLN